MILEAICLCGLIFAGSKARQKYHTETTNPKQANRALASQSKNTRQQLFKQIHSPEEENERRQREKKENQNIAIAAASFTLSIVGSLFYAPLAPISMIGLFYLNWNFAKSAYHSLVEKRQLNAGFLITVNSILCFTYGYYVLANLAVLLWATSTKFLNKIEDNSKKDLIDVFKKQSRFVWVYLDGVEVEITFEALKQGDIVVIHAGETIPIDGRIKKGTALVDQHLLTGESQPVEKGIDDEVFALTVVLSGTLHVYTEKTGNGTTSAQIGQILNEMVDFKTDRQLKARKAADQSILPALIAGGVTYPVFGALGPLVINASMPIEKLLIPTAFSVMSTFKTASQQGILIKDGRTLELLKKVDTVVFDKTGTLTVEQPQVVQIYTCGKSQTEEVLTYAAAAEYKQKHPIAKAIQDKALALGLSLPEVAAAEYKMGYGITVTINEKLVRVGSSRFIEMEGITIPNDIHQHQMLCHEQGHSLILVALNNEVIGAIECQPTVRPEAQKVINALRQYHGIKTMAIISGDHEQPTQKLADSLGIPKYFAQVLPQEKAKLIEQLQADGKVVCYVGDGINDAIALKQANVSVSLSGSSTVAIDTAQVVLMDENLEQLQQLFYIAHHFDTNMKRIFTAVITSSIMAIGGCLFLHLGLLYAILINQVGFATGIGIAIHASLKNNSPSTPRIEKIN